MKGLTVVFTYPQGLGAHRLKKHGVPGTKGHGRDSEAAGDPGGA